MDGSNTASFSYPRGIEGFGDTAEGLLELTVSSVHDRKLVQRVGLRLEGLQDLTRDIAGNVLPEFEVLEMAAE